MKKKLFLLIPVLFFFASCATKISDEALAETAENAGTVFVTNSKKIKPLKTFHIEEKIDSTFLFEGNFNGSSFSFLALTYCDSECVEIMLSNELGISIGNLIYDGNIIEFSSSVLPKNLKAQYIIADLQNALYFAQALKANYKKSNLIFEEQISDKEKIRYIKNSDSKIIEEITYSKNEEKIKITVNNKLRAYKYTLTQLD